MIPIAHPTFKPHFIVFACLLWLSMPLAASAHVGAPYPVLVEEPVGPYEITVLADPDVGIGTFLVTVELLSEGSLPADTQVRIAVRAHDGHAPEESHSAHRQNTRQGPQYVAKVPFDAGGQWTVHLLVEGSEGVGSALFDVKVTPPYPGLVTTLACLIPFAVLGALWVAGTLRSRRRELPASIQHDDQAGES